MSSIIPIRPFGKDPAQLVLPESDVQESQNQAVVSSVGPIPPPITDPLDPLVSHPPHDPNTNGTKGFSIILRKNVEAGIDGVLYRGELYHVLMDLRPWTEDKFHLYQFQYWQNVTMDAYKNVQKAGNRKSPSSSRGIVSAPFMHAVFKTLYLNANHNVLQADVMVCRDKVAEVFNQYQIASLTKIKREVVIVATVPSQFNSPSFVDVVTHAVGLPMQSSERVSAGSGLVKLLSTGQHINTCSAWLSDPDPNFVSHIYKWLTGKDVFLAYGGLGEGSFTFDAANALGHCIMGSSPLDQPTSALNMQIYNAKGEQCHL